jgi:rhodanese-related sulfurtransferase
VLFISMLAAGKLPSHIRGTTLLAQIEAGTAPTVIDVRSQREFADGHVPGARHIPFWALLTRMSQISTSPAAPVVVYCGHGPRAYVAGAFLRASGFRRVMYLKGHFLKWRQAGLRQEIGSGSWRTTCE